MMFRKLLKRTKLFRFLVVFIVLVVTFIAARRVLAILYTIDTNDDPATVQEWFDQGIMVWHTDPVGDVITPTEDIVNARVASGDDGRIYFMMELAGSPALETMLRQAAAYIDCDGDGDNGGLGDADDVIVLYQPHEDTTIISRGDQNNLMTTEHPEDGQRIDQYVEWGVPIASLPPTNPILQSSSDCQHEVYIRFATTKTTSYPGVMVDETEPFQWFNVPTAIKLNGFDTAGSQPGLDVLIPVGLMISALGVGGYFLLKKNKN